MLENTSSITFIALSMIALQMAIVFLLAYKYLRTRNIGFIWLGVAVVIWPLVSRILDWSKRFVVSSRWLQLGHIGSFVTLTTFLQQLVGTVFLFLAVFYLCRMQNESAIPLK